MGHSVNSVGYRLGYHKNWKSGSVVQSSTTAGSLLLLDSFFTRFFDRFGASLVYSHFFLARSPVGGTNHLVVFFYSHLWQRLLRFVWRRSLKFASFSFRSDRFFEKGVDLPSALFDGQQDVPASRYFNFLKYRLEQGVLSLFAPILAKTCSVLKISSVSSHLVDRSPLTPPLFARFILFKLKRRYGLARVINSFLQFNLRLLSKAGVIGVFFKAAGRFSKTQRASALSVKRGKTPFSTISTYVDQFSLSINLKYGSCNLVVWVAYSPLSL